MNVAESLTALDADWADDALRASGHNRARVIELEVNPVAFTGATTAMARLHFTYSEPDAGPATAIAKIRGTTEVQRKIDSAAGLFDREGQFYSTFAARVPIASPACYHVGNGDTTPLLLEDLGDHRMGDQMEGLTVADAETLMTCLADFHAAFWNAEETSAPWLLRHDAGPYPELVAQLAVSGTPALRERYADVASGAVIEQVIAAAPRWRDILRIAAEGPPTLVHNDCRLDNVFFGTDGKPILIDWQVLSRTRGTQDIANLLAGSMDPADLSRHWERLLRLWYDRLTSWGVRGYSFDQAVTHYRQNVFFPLAAGLALIGRMDIGDGRGLGDIIVTRCLRHIDEVDAFAALDAR